MSDHKQTNRLIHETSPYLLQHAHNPVDWYAWGAEALEKARTEEKPIFLSIGYSACHWCHVMERESFENEVTARLMNERFVNIKVDREERPDLDAIYMEAVVAMTGSGGWPMSVFLTPEGQPFYGGTYYPPELRYGMPSFRQVLQSVADAYQNRRNDVLGQAARLTSALQNVLAPFLARDRGNRIAEQVGMERVFAAAMLFVPVTTVATASFFPTLELMVWGGKWSAINGGLYFLCIGATYATIAGILTGPLLGLQRFKAVAGFEVGKMAGTIGGAVLGALLVWLDSTNSTPRYEPITVICVTTGAAMTIASLAQLVWIMRQYKVSPRDMVQHLTFGPALALLTALAAQSIGHSIQESMALSEGRLGAGLEFIAVATIYCTLIILGVRFTAEETLRTTLDVLPAPARRFLHRVLVLD